MNKTKLSSVSLANWLRIGAGGSRRRDKGHFVVYSKGGRRFVVPLKFLDHPIFQVLLEMAEEELGTGSRAALTVPCEDELMMHLVSLLRTCTFDLGVI
ncbi:hypothetical protein LUZ62_051386 [Rhynchospora pubera]|uniref:Small auxin up regulated protein n=1 Tax=Rhynchospora pubera TaxID=906938 RepID=A0AAV8G7D3_9POAL|nr:hypothetical protein LUZ62_051386 [Rhynchospora pubera]